MNPNTIWTGIGVLAIVIVGCSPLWAGTYFTSVITMTLIFIALTSAWNIVGGMAGQFSLGNSLFVGCGGTLVGALVTQNDWSIWSALIVGALAAAVLAFIIACLMFRSSLPHLAFAIVTLALAEAGLLFVTSTDALGAGSGIVLKVKDGTMASLSSPGQKLWLALIVTIIVVLISWGLLHSKLGFRMRAARDDESAAAAIGVSLFWTKTIALVVSAVLSSVVATIFASYVVFIDPDQFASPILSITIILYAVVGGLGTVRGPILGAGLLYPLGEILRGEFGDVSGLHLVIFGLAIILIVLYAPGGLAGLLSKLFGRRPSAFPPLTDTGLAGGRFSIDRADDADGTSDTDSTTKGKDR
jgi:branched-chain amino acid transport system permease protein